MLYLQKDDRSLWQGLCEGTSSHYCSLSNICPSFNHRCVPAPSSIEEVATGHYDGAKREQGLSSAILAT